MEFSDSVLLVITVPKSHGDLLRKTLGEAGAGQIGGYSHCSHTTDGIGRFAPQKGAKPYLGSFGILEEVLEERIETFCPKNLVDSVVQAIYEVHPYEEPSVYIYPFYQMPWKKPYEQS